MAEIYNKAQVDGIFAALRAKIATRTAGQWIVDQIAAFTGLHLMTQAERDKLAGLEGSKFRGTFSSSAVLPLTGNTVGSYGDVDTGPGNEVKRWIWDNDDSTWFEQGASAGPLTSAQVLTLYEANPDRNGFTDADKGKLDGLTYADDISAALAAIEAELPT